MVGTRNIRGKVNNNCKAWRYSGDVVEIEIRTPENKIDFNVMYNVKTTDFSIKRRVDRTLSLSSYDQHTQASLDNIKNELAKYQLALDLTQDLIKKMNLDQIL